MRGVVLCSLVVMAPSAWAEAPGEAAADPYASCLDQRHAIYERATATDDLATRGRMLAQMPTCSPGMTGGAEVNHVAQADAIAAAYVVETRRDRRWTVGFEPFGIRKNTYMVGVQYAVAPRVGVALHGGFGRTEHVSIGDTYHWYYLDERGDAPIVAFTEKQIGARASYFVLQDKQGVHVGADVTYQHFGSPGRDGPTNPWQSIEGLGLSAFAGWRMVTLEGLTMELQVGPMLLWSKTTTDLMPAPGWERATGMHWYSSFIAGYSF